MDRTMAEEVLVLVERRTEEMEVATAMERFTAIAGEHDMVLGELLKHALDTSSAGTSAKHSRPSVQRVEDSDTVRTAW
jgi:hypothetical protein